MWKLTLSISTLRLMEAAESLSIADWKLLTDVRLLGLAESLHEADKEKSKRGGGGKQKGNWGGWKKKTLHLVHKGPQEESLNATTNTFLDIDTHPTKLKMAKEMLNAFSCIRGQTMGNLAKENL